MTIREALEAALISRGWTRCERRGRQFWQHEDEPGVIFDTSEAVVQAVEDAA